MKEWAYPRQSWSREESPEQHKEVDLFLWRSRVASPALASVALRSGRRGDTPPVGRQDALLKATGGHTPDQGGDPPTPSLQLPRPEETASQVGLSHVINLYPLTPPWTFAL